MNRSESELSSEAEFEDARDHLTKSDPPSQAQSPCSSGAWGSPQKIQSLLESPVKRRDLSQFRSNIITEFDGAEHDPPYARTSSLVLDESVCDSYSVSAGSMLSWRGGQTLKELIYANRELEAAALDTVSTRASYFPPVNTRENPMHSQSAVEMRSAGNSTGNSSATINAEIGAASMTDEKPTISFSTSNSPTQAFGPPPPLPPGCGNQQQIHGVSKRAVLNALSSPPPFPPPPLPSRPPTLSEQKSTATTLKDPGSASGTGGDSSWNKQCSGDGAPISKSGGGRSSSSKLIRRGHAKTKSLDYKYMLSQLPNQQSSSTTASQNAQNSSLTAGAKSNSLTRGAFPNELLLTTTTNGGGGLENAEENAAERINNAKGVVQQIITKELEFESSSSRESEKADEQRQKAAVCSSTSNSLRHTASGRDDSNSRSPELVAEAEEDELVPPLPFSPLPHPQLSPRHHHPGGGQIFHTPASYRLPTTNTNELEILGEECSSVSSSATRETISRQCEIPPLPMEEQRVESPLPTRDSISPIRLQKPAEQPSQQQFIGRRSNSMEYTPRAPQLKQHHLKTESVDLRHRTLTQVESIDPIARDLELKIQQQEKDDTLKRNDESSLSSSGTSHKISAGVARARNLLRTCGMSATAYVWSAFKKARSITTRESAERLEPTSTSSGGAVAGGGGVHDDAASSISSISQPSLRSTFVVAPPAVPVSSTPAPALAAQVICRPKNTKKGPFDFEQLKLVQEMNNEHTGAIWVIKFSQCGRALATAGQDCIVRVWVLRESFSYFARKRREYNKDQQDLGGGEEGLAAFPATLHGGGDVEGDKGPHSSTFIPSNASISTQSTSSSSMSFSTQTHLNHHQQAAFSSVDGGASVSGGGASQSQSMHVFAPKPFCVFRGHTGDIVDLDWSRANDYYLLSAGMDKTIKLWHLFFGTCLGHFTHPEPVTCVGFLPKDSRYFISGCLDGRIRLWSAHEKKVVMWNEVEQVKFITAMTFVKKGKFVAIGTYSGRCFFYTTDLLKYHTVIDVRSSSGKNSSGHKICSLDHNNNEKLLVTSSDSRVRMYDLRDMELTCKFKGAQIQKTHVRASFSPDGRHIISGSEDNFIYLWRTGLGFSPSSTSGTSSLMQKNKNSQWERFRTAENSVVTSLILGFLEAESQRRALLAIRLGNWPNSNALALDSRPQEPTSSKSRRKLTAPGPSSGGGGSSSLILSGGVSSQQNALTSVNLSDLQQQTPSSSSAATKRFPSYNPRAYLTKSTTLQNLKAPGASGSGTNNSAAIRSGGENSNNPGGVSGMGKSTSTRETTTARGASGSSTNGDVIITADLNGSIKVYANPAAFTRTGSSVFFQPKF